MAKIGLTNFRFGILTEAQDGTPSYAGALTPGKAISFNAEVENNEAFLYADDTIAESDTSFRGGTATMGIDEDDTTTMSTLLGHQIDEETNEMVSSTEDVAPYVGVGRVVTKMVNGVYKYQVKFLYKVKFAEPSDEDNTKGEDIEFGTTEIEGTIMALANGKWRVSKTFDTKADAISYLEGLLGNTPSV